MQQPRSRAICAGDCPAVRARRTASERNSGVYGGFVLAMWTPFRGLQPPMLGCPQQRVNSIRDRARVLFCDRGPSAPIASYRRARSDSRAACSASPGAGSLISSRMDSTALGTPPAGRGRGSGRWTRRMSCCADGSTVLLAARCLPVLLTPGSTCAPSPSRPGRPPPLPLGFSCAGSGCDLLLPGTHLGDGNVERACPSGRFAPGCVAISGSVRSLLVRKA